MEPLNKTETEKKDLQRVIDNKSFVDYNYQLQQEETPESKIVDLNW